MATSRLPFGFRFATADLTDLFWLQVEKERQLGDPLLKQLGPVNEDQGAALPASDKIGPHDGLP